MILGGGCSQADTIILRFCAGVNPRVNRKSHFSVGNTELWSRLMVSDAVAETLWENDSLKNIPIGIAVKEGIIIG